jgi:hypothetical protein
VGKVYVVRLSPKDKDEAHQRRGQARGQILTGAARAVAEKTETKSPTPPARQGPFASAMLGSVALSIPDPGLMRVRASARKVPTGVAQAAVDLLHETITASRPE